MEALNELRAIDFQDLVIFTTVYETRSITDTAQRLHTSKSSVSYALKKLKHCYDDDLFLSRRFGVVPTDKADSLYPLVIDILKLTQGTLQPDQRTDHQAEKYTFTLIVPEYFELLLLPELVSAFADTGAECDFHTLPLDQDIPLDALASDDVDLVMGFGPNHHKNHDTILSETLLNDRLVCLTSDPGLAGREHLTLDEFIARHHIYPTPWSSRRNMIDGWLYDAGVQRRKRVFCNSYQAAMLCAERSGHLLSLPARVLPLLKIPDTLHTLNGPEGFPSFTLNMIWSYRQNDDPANALLRQTLRDIGQRLSPLSA